MFSRNQSSDAYFILSVFADVHWLNILLSLLSLAIGIVTLLTNTLLILLQIIDIRLHTPMYFFLSHLYFIDICCISTIVPKMLDTLLMEDKYISFLGCAAQMFLILALGGTECLLLAIMAYDRYVAICKPLHYHALMSRRICLLLVVSCWTIGLVNAFFHTLFTFMRPFCKSREISRFYCEIQPILRASCADTRAHEMWIFASVTTLVLCASLLTLISYIFIISTILKIQSTEGRSKVFSTCSSHLVVVIIYYGTILSVYMRPISSYYPERDALFGLLYSLLIPMCNPLLYSVRNRDVKAAISKAAGDSFFRIKT